MESELRLRQDRLARALKDFNITDDCGLRELLRTPELPTEEVFRRGLRKSSHILPAGVTRKYVAQTIVQALRQPIPRKVDDDLSPRIIMKIAKLTNHGVMVGGDNGGTIKMSNNSNTFGDGNTVNGNVVASGSIQESFNAINNSSASDELKGKLNELTDLVSKLMAELTEDEARDAGSSLLAVTRQAVEEKPNKGLLKAGAQGLLETAKPYVGFFGALATAVKAILALKGVHLH